MYLSHEDVAKYHRDGYLLVEGLFKREEVDAMLHEVEHGRRVAETTETMEDAQGMKSKLAYWETLTDDIWSRVTMSPRITNNVRILLGEEMSFYHGKVMLKKAREGGAWEWHQDYGYWYDGGFMYPHMISVFTALDEATTENGCLKVLKGSHKLQRIDHGKVGDQAGIDPERIKQIESMFELVEVQMKPGSALFFHCNLLHSSGPNLSEKHRRSFIMCYNAVANPSFLVMEKKWEPCPVGSDQII